MNNLIVPVWFVVLWLFSCFICAVMDWPAYAIVPMIAIPLMIIAWMRDRHNAMNPTHTIKTVKQLAARIRWRFWTRMEAWYELRQLKSLNEAEHCRILKLFCRGWKVEASRNVPLP